MLNSLPENAAYNLLPDEWSDVCKENKLPNFRTKQIVQGLYKDRIKSWDELTTLPLAIRTKFTEEFPIQTMKIVDRTSSASDGVIKYLLEASDGERIETVFIPADGRITQCISTQVGCAMHCAFCASGQLGCVRSLTTDEIVAQVMTVANISGAYPNNIVVMGMGEPFNNYDAVLKALKILNSQSGINIGARHITISTCGIVPGIKRLATEGLQFELSVSLHAPTDEIRNKIMPVNKKWDLSELMPACKEYTEKTGRIVTYEYTLVKNMNDRPIHAQKLLDLLRGQKVRVNLIPLSPVKEFHGATPSHEDCLTFLDIMLKAGINTTLRRSRGKQADAACGQLRLRNLKEKQND